MKMRAIFKTIVFFCFVAILFGCGKEKKEAPKASGPASPPTSVKAAPDVRTVVLNWTLVPGATAYKIYMASAADITQGNFSLLPEGAVHIATGSPFKIPGTLTNGITYYFRISAVDGNGESALSAEVSTTVSDSIAVALAAGKEHTCALIGNGTVKCWGANYSGQLGNGLPGPPTGATSKPTLVNGISTAVAITAGAEHTCALLANKTVMCWGKGGSGRLGGGTVSLSIPTSVTGITTAEHVFAGEEHTCAVLTDQTVICWGNNQDGQLGSGHGVRESTTPLPVKIKRTTIMTVGYRHACADNQDSIESTPRVKCWGDNGSGQLGINTTQDSTVPSTVKGGGFKTQKEGVVTDVVRSLAAGLDHTCAVIEDGSVNCWGSLEHGQVGDGRSDPVGRVKQPVLVSGIVGAQAVAAGRDHTCAIRVNDEVVCWGRGDVGQIGNGSLDNALVPTLVPNLLARRIVGGGNHTCAIRFNGGVQCWGSNTFGQLGNGQYANSDVPVTVNNVVKVTAVATGDAHTCVLAMDLVQLQCWGSNESGQLGNGTFVDAFNPVPVVDIVGANVKAIAAGGQHTCALLVDQTVKCWGKNKDGQIGDSTKPVNQPRPVQVSNLLGVTKISAGKAHTCVVGTQTSGTVAYCWGRNSDGQIGDGGTADTIVPTLIDSTASGVDIAAGGSHTCWSLADGQAGCWGSYEDGQLGTGDIGTAEKGVNFFFTTPRFLKGDIRNASKIFSGTRHSCVLLSDNNLKCWGGNKSGQVGYGAKGNIAVPQLVVGIGGLLNPRIKSVSAGEVHTCALLDTGKVRCWGDNGAGQLGTGGNDGVTSATLNVVNLDGATEISAGAEHTCAIISGASPGSSTLTCWGDNTFGQLGLGIPGLHASPIAVLEIP